jgi:GNAT superfamily N-acetyltransferase
VKFKQVPAGVRLLITRRAKKIEVDILTVLEELRGRGLGTRAMRNLQKLGQPIELTAVPDSRRKATLHRFYTRLGFRPLRKSSSGFTVFSWTPKS